MGTLSFSHARGADTIKKKQIKLSSEFTNSAMDITVLSALFLSAMDITVVSALFLSFLSGLKGLWENGEGKKVCDAR